MKNLTVEELANIANRSFEAESDSILATRDCFDAEAFSKAVYALAAAERVSLSGCGHSGIACAHFAHSLCCIDKTARFQPPSDMLHGGMGFLK